MGLDIRLPIGLLFSILGLVLALYGVVGDKAIYQRSLGYNVNLIWGLVLLFFGLVSLYYGRKGSSAMHPAATTPEGQATEKLEKEEGLES